MQEFSGAGTSNTSLFKVRDQWEVRWNARHVVSVAVMSPDGTIVAGAAGVLRGSLFIPLGGRYYLKVSDGTGSPSGTPAPPTSSTNAPSPFGTPAPPTTSTNALIPPDAPAPSPAPPAETDNSSSPPSERAVSWHLQVVQLGTAVASNQALTVFTPFFIVPDSAVTPAPPPPNPPPPVLTDDQAHTVVTIKGDNAEGIGFLMRSPDGTFVVTHLHLLAANPHIKVFTSSGVLIPFLSLKGATDRDLALFTIHDNHFTYLPLPADALNSFDEGDQLIIPDIGPLAEVLPGVRGKVIGANPLRLDFDNAIRPGHTGAPVIHVKSGAVLASVTAEKQIDLSENIAKAWPANPPPGSGGIHYFGLRLTGVQSWETYDWNRFLSETLFLKQFHENTRCLDSYLNDRLRRPQETDDNKAFPYNPYFLNSIKICTANDAYKQSANGGDKNQRLDAATELLFDLQGIADTNMNTLQGMNLYSYNRTCAQEEIAYRKALKKELDDLGNNISRMDDIARSR